MNSFHRLLYNCRPASSVQCEVAGGYRIKSRKIPCNRRQSRRGPASTMFDGSAAALARPKEESSWSKGKRRLCSRNASSTSVSCSNCYVALEKHPMIAQKGAKAFVTSARSNMSIAAPSRRCTKASPLTPSKHRDGG